MQVYTTELYHHGVKGQKWGVRKQVANEIRNTSVTAANTVTEFKKTKEYYKHLKKAKGMTNEELKEKAARLNLENNYINAQLVQSGRSRISSTLTTIGAVTTIALGAITAAEKVSNMLGE